MDLDHHGFPVYFQKQVAVPHKIPGLNTKDWHNGGRAQLAGGHGRKLVKVQTVAHINDYHRMAGYQWERPEKNPHPGRRGQLQ